MDATISKLIQYKNAIEIDDFIDFLYSQKFVDENDYGQIWKRQPPDRLHKLFELLKSKNDLEKILEYLKNTYPNNKTLVENDRSFQITSIRGGFPKLPPNYVKRDSLASEVRSKLVNIQWDTKLVVHGTMGYGKSCLVNEVLNDRIVRECFDNCLFWINLGDCHNKEDVLQPMLRLYTAASTFIQNRTTHYLDVQSLQDLLRDLFLNDGLKNSLIVLDDACNEDVLSCFDIGCRTVITTQNKNILRSEDAEFVEVKTGFSLEESFKLFEKALKINHDELPSYAEKIHNISQGHPLRIALIGSYLQENAEVVGDKRNVNRIAIWEYIENMLLRGNYRLNEYNNVVDIPHMIKKCIESLLTVLKDLYQDLAIFQQDVNIPPGVLEILWNKNHHEVRNIMNKFVEKSLIKSFYHNDLNTYIYGIHDIHLNYLRDITKERIIHLHRKLISGYDRVTDKDYAKLPDDNYTFQYIGYHLYCAELFDRFAIYFDFNFLERKLRAVGKQDVLRDMEKYKVYITRQDHKLIEKLGQYKDFINRCGGNLYSFEKTDIIQYALRENKDSCVFKDALVIAKDSSRLYFQSQKPVEELDYSQIINIKEDITYACFVDSPQHILIGTTNGKIKLFYEQSVKEISNFIGHTKAIKNLIVSPVPDKTHFLSVSEDGTVMLWKFSADSSRNSRDFTHPLQVSPRTKQSYWQDIHTPDRGQVQPRKTFSVPDNDDYLISAAFCNTFPDPFRVVTGSHRGNVIVWDAFTGTALYQTGHRGIETPCVMYLEKSPPEIIFSCEDSIFTYTVVDEKITYSKILHNVDICCTLFLTGDDVIAISEKSFSQWRSLKKIKLHRVSEENKSNICSTLTDDEQYLVVSTNRGTVYIWNIDEWKMMCEFENKGLAKSLDTFYDEDKRVHILLIGSDKKTLQQCHIQPYDKEPHVENLPVFTPFWKRKNALTAIVSQENRIQIFSGYIQISETEVIKSQVKCTCFSACGSYVIYGLENGEIHLFHLKTKINTPLDEEQKEPITYLSCYDPTNSFRSSNLNSCGSNDSLDFGDQHIGVIVSTTYRQVIVYNNKKKLIKLIEGAKVFCKANRLIIVDKSCCTFTWNIDTDTFVKLSNEHLMKSAAVTIATFCLHKLILAVVYEQAGNNFVDVYGVAEASAELWKRDLSEQVRSLSFSGDGSLLAAGFKSGEIKVWNLNDDYKSLSLKMFNDAVHYLQFSPSMEPVLVSLADEMAWWNLKPFLKSSARKRGRPNSINILNGLSSEMDCMDISYWSERKPLADSEYLLSCIKLNGKAKYVSASRDFNSFLAVDDKGKVYIMEIVHPDS